MWDHFFISYILHIIWMNLFHFNDGKAKEGDVRRTSNKNCQTCRWFSVRFSFISTQMKYFFFRPIGQIINENVIEFFVRLCGDVILKVLRYGNRRRLIKLERVGLRFHLIVENFFGVVPFLRLDLLLLRSKFNILELMWKLLDKMV